jgi:hypothetical protein
MDDKAIRAKYGGKLAKAINRAIRAEIPGGNEALDKLTQLAGAARHSQWKDKAGRNTAEAEAYFRHKRDVVDRMDAEVRKKWGVPPGEESKPAAAPRRPKGAGHGRRQAHARKSPVKRKGPAAKRP